MRELKGTPVLHTYVTTQAKASSSCCCHLRVSPAETLSAGDSRSEYATVVIRVANRYRTDTRAASIHPQTRSTRVFAHVKYVGFHVGLTLFGSSDRHSSVLFQIHGRCNHEKR